ncbi:MAG: hypothetical protein AB7Q16_11570 [Vicinamibacterales bacterium]
MSRFRRTGLALALIVGQLAPAAAQAPSAPRTPPAPRRPSGGDSPFRLKGFAGTSFEAASLEQPGCPLAVRVVRLNRSERGVTLSLELNNLGDTPVRRQVIGAWVLVPDGTVRGYQRFVGERGIEPAEYRTVDLIVRTTPVLPDDVIVVAVQEAIGDAERPWRREVKELEREVKRAVQR